MASILLIDDEADVVSRNTKALVADGHEVTAVTGTADAVRAVRTGDHDIVVLEAMLDGGMAGFDLARRLAREFPNLPLIMLTRVDEHIGDEELARQDRDGGWLPVQRFMQKPLMPEVLAYEIDHLLSAVA